MQGCSHQKVDLFVINNSPFVSCCIGPSACLPDCHVGMLALHAVTHGCWRQVRTPETLSTLQVLDQEFQTCRYDHSGLLAHY